LSSEFNNLRTLLSGKQRENTARNMVYASKEVEELAHIINSTDDMVNRIANMEIGQLLQYMQTGCDSVSSIFVSQEEG
jgi:hypothetical protein